MSIHPSLDDLSLELVNLMRDAKHRATGGLQSALDNFTHHHQLSPLQTIELKRRYKINKETVL